MQLNNLGLQAPADVARFIPTLDGAKSMFVLSQAEQDKEASLVPVHDDWEIEHNKHVNEMQRVLKDAFRDGQEAICIELDRLIKPEEDTETFLEPENNYEEFGNGFDHFVKTEAVNEIKKDKSLTS